MFYILESQDHELVGMILFAGSGWGLDFCEGKRVPLDFDERPIIVELQADHDELPDYFEIDGTPIVSEGFARTWRALPLDNYQLFPVLVRLPGHEISTHFILNIVGLVSCVDQNASDCQVYESSIMRILNLVVDVEATSLELFRAREYPLAIFISNSIRQALDDAKLSGMSIRPADGWNDLHRF